MPVHWAPPVHGKLTEMGKGTWGFPGASDSKESAMQETWVRSLGQKDL